jgi:hypothetical protein
MMARMGVSLMFRPTVFVAIMVVAGSSGAIAEDKPLVLHSGRVPIGSLGHPLGSYLTVEGVRLDAPKTGVSTLRIDAINGQKLGMPVDIWIDNLDLPKEKRCKIKGYETMRMIGKPPAESDAEEEQGKPAPQPQAAWQVQLYFVALSVVEPKDLRPRPHRP